MELVYEGEHGSARYYKSKSLKICGKTGSSQNPFGDSHSVFIAFAPVDDPKIAIAVLVENKGFGSLWAAPIATLMIKKYLQDDFVAPYYESNMLKN